MKTPANLLSILAILLLSLAALHAAPRPGFGTLYYEGEIVRTIVPPAAMKKMGTDDLYVTTAPAHGRRNKFRKPAGFVTLLGDDVCARLRG